MSLFLRLLNDIEKGGPLADLCARVRGGDADTRIFDIIPERFGAVSGKPFAYWVSDAVRNTFVRLPPFESGSRKTRVGLQTSDDFRFVRVWWEIPAGALSGKWFPLAKGGRFSRWYVDIFPVVNWGSEGRELKAWADPLYGNSGWSRILKSTEFYGRAGLSWPLRGIRFSAQAVPKGAVFSVAGKMAFAPDHELGTWLGILNSCAFDYLIGLFAGKVGGVQYEVGLIGRIPTPLLSNAAESGIDRISRRAWSLKRTLDTVEETSHAFLLPVALRPKVGEFDARLIEAELARIQREIDDIAFDLYGFTAIDRAAATQSPAAAVADNNGSSEEAEEEEDAAPPPDTRSALLSWAVGVAFGRFDWRLATRERAAPPEPEPFDPLPARSPGMLPDGAEPFHQHMGILVDDPGHPHDLSRLVEEVLTRVDAPQQADVRQWLSREFFSFHLQRYSKSRRKAPIYWPLSTVSGSYTLWVYYPQLNGQTVYIAVNDLVEPKLKHVGGEVASLRIKAGARSRDDERRFESLQSLELELIELRDTLLRIASQYRPNQDDGVQITAAPLWPLFRHKPWQKILKDTWAKLEKGDYDWAHLAMSYWPERVREKCKTDKSLAIAHGLEQLYQEPAPKGATKRARKVKDA